MEIKKNIKKNWEYKIYKCSNDKNNIFKIANLLKKRTTMSPLIVNNQPFVSDEKRANILADQFALAHQNPLALDKKLFTSKINKEYKRIIKHGVTAHPSIKLKEIVHLIKKLKNSKSPGLDNITSILLKNLPRTALAYIQTIFNLCLQNFYFPNCWKKASVVAIPKHHKDLTHSSSYRPISLLSHLSKVFEKIILSKLNEHIYSKTASQTFNLDFGHSTLLFIKSIKLIHM